MCEKKIIPYPHLLYTHLTYTLCTLLHLCKKKDALFNFYVIYRFVFEHVIMNNGSLV